MELSPASNEERKERKKKKIHSATEEETFHRNWSCGLIFTASGHLICKIVKFRYRNKIL